MAKAVASIAIAAIGMTATRKPGKEMKRLQARLNPSRDPDVAGSRGLLS
jgi:hypothetical protein